MTITFYNVVDDPRVVNKALGAAVGSATGVLHERVNSLSMTIRVPSAYFNYITQSNYAMIDTFQKYYYLESYDIQNDCVYINLREDVLKSFATQIGAMVCTVARTENERKADAYLIDPEYKAKAYKKYVQRNFPNSIEDFSYILITVG